MGCLKISLSLVFLMVSMMQMLGNVEPKTYWGDRKILKKLKDRVDPKSVTPGSCLSSWDFSVDPCDNLFSERFTCGFRCDLTISGGSRVTELSLDQAGYSGLVTSFSWNLPYLKTLDLSSNNFYGQIPDSFSNLTRLVRLGLSRNWLSGEIPTSIGSLTSLEELYLDNNNLQGTIPPSFNGLVSLKRLDIQSNKLSGGFPELGSLVNLHFLDASDNAISGELPTTLPASLIEMLMRNNSLQGTIRPQSFKNSSLLQVMDLSHNSLSGFVPSFLFTHSSLQQLTLSHNSFTSVQSPPAALTTVSQSDLIALDLSNNEIQGFLPYFLALMPKLSALSLENNKFTGMIPTQYAIKAVVPGSGVSAFARLLLGGNYLSGPLPGLLTDLKSGSANVTLNDNCFYQCPVIFYFCQGSDQKSAVECKSFNPPVIP